MEWLKKLFGPKAAEVADALDQELPDFSTASVEELTAYNQAQDARIRQIQLTRAAVAARIDALLTGN
jgi:anti-sigma factor RsiW